MNYSDNQLKLIFSKLDSDKSGGITPAELQRALVNGDWTTFNMDTVQLLFNMFDVDRNGTIHYQEFFGLWRYIEQWRKLFATFDRDGSGLIDIDELMNAMKTFQININKALLIKLIRKYKLKHIDTSVKKNQQLHETSVNFDNFVQICVTVKTVTDLFRQLDGNNDGWAEINYEKFLEVMFNQSF
nr:1622_t:CDS:1 [Entrophospora candida]